MCLSQLLDPGPRVGEPGPHERCAGARGSPEVGGQAGSQLQVGVCRRWMRPCSKVSNSAPGANQASAGSSRAEASGVQLGGPGSRGGHWSSCPTVTKGPARQTQHLPLAFVFN